MTPANHTDSDRALLRRRLASQQIAAPRHHSAVELVRWMGAVQAQDYAGGLWAVGLRVNASVEAEVERAIAAAEIVRTWPMRGTLHLVAAEDVRWMVRLLAPRVLARAAGRYRQLGLEDADFARAERVLTRALRGGRRLTRAQAYAALERGGVAPTGQRGIHVLGHLAQSAVLCFGPREGKQPTFVLLEEWVPPAREPSRDEALATLALRFFTSHGPATLQDFVWWSGLAVADARAALASVRTQLIEEGQGKDAMYAAAASPRSGGRRSVAALLPVWDEYLVAYRDRTSAARELPGAKANGLDLIGKPLVLVDGTVRGSWRRELRPSKVRVTVELWTPLSTADRRALDQALARYGRFVDREVEVAAAGGRSVAASSPAAP
jgi:hypothetical protein